MKKVFFLILVIFNLSALAQNPRPPVTNYTPEDYGPMQTPNNYCVFQDKRGFIYAGNSGGVLVFDGKNWELIEVQAGSFVNNIIQSERGNIFVATTSGEFGQLTNGKQGRMEFKSMKNLFAKNKIKVDYIERIHSTSSGIYIQSRAELLLLNGDKITSILTGSSYHLTFCVNNKIYARERQVGLIEISGTKKTVLSSVEEFRDYGIFGICPLKKNELFIATQEKGLWSFNLKSKKLTYLNNDSIALKSQLIYGATALKNGKFALNTLNSGVIIVKSSGETIMTLNKSSGIRVNDVKHLIEDEHENLWLALSNGISVIDHTSFLNYYDDKSGLLGNVECAVKYNGRLYVGTSEGLFTSNDTDEEKNFISIPSIKSHVWDIKACDNKLFIATDVGLFSGNASGFTMISSGVVNSIAAVKNNSQLIAASPSELQLFDVRSGNQLDQTGFFEDISRAYFIKEDPANVDGKTIAWMGTIGNGVARISIENSTIAYEFFENLEENALIYTRPIVVKGKIMICTAYGLRKIEYEKDGSPFFNFADLHPELDDARITDVVESGDKIWICADNKIMYLNQKNELIKTPFLPVEVGQIFNLFAEDNQTCWIAGADGLIRYYESETKNYNLPFKLHLRRVNVNGDSTLFHGNWFNNGILTNAQGINDEFSLPYKLNTLEFVFSAQYYNHTHQLHYSHRLEGNDEEWSNWSTDSKVKYSNLREGSYTLKVKARNIYGYESEVLSFTFTVFPPWYRTTTAYIIYGILAILIFIVTNRILSYRLKQKNIQLEQLVQKRTKEIAQKNEELHERNIQITLQKQEITDSINYAQKIQEAMLPAMNEMSNRLSGSFILFKPKDIVSGDFYWVGYIDEKLILICADCTGHGVPGAFMSMLCIDKLNQIIPEKKIIRPDKILEEANKGIKKSLGQSDEENLRTKDGMDCAVVVIDTKKMLLTYSGANRPLWKISGGEVIEFKPDKCAVGGFTREDQQFTLHEIAIKKGDRFYTSTDGYADQFGGPAGKKIMVRNFKNLILENQQLSFNEQKELLDQFVEDWKKQFSHMGEETEQVDDICVMGFEI